MCVFVRAMSSTFSFPLVPVPCALTSPSHRIQPSHQSAQEAYGELAVERGDEVDEAVLEMWAARRNECLRRLGSWEPLKEGAEEAAASAEEEMPAAGDVGAAYDMLWRHERRRQQRGGWCVGGVCRCRRMNSRSIYKLSSHTNTTPARAGLAESALPLWVEAAVRLYAEGPASSSPKKEGKKKGRKRGREEEEEDEVAEEGEEERYIQSLRKVCVYGHMHKPCFR